MMRKMGQQPPGDALIEPGPQVEATEWEACANLAQALLRETDEESIVQVFLETLPSLLPASCCAVALKPQNRSDYCWAAGQHENLPLSARLLDRIAELCQQGLASEILAQAPPLMREHRGLLIAPERFDLCGLNPGSILAAAIRTERTDFGILLVGKGTETYYSPGEHLRACLLANQLAHALETAALYADTRHRDRELALIYQTGQRITQLLDLSELTSQLVAAVSKTFGYESVTLLLVDEATHELVVKATFGLREETHVGFRIPITDELEGGMVGWVAHHGKPFLAPDVRLEKRYLKTVEETRSELDVPLKIKGRVIGVLDVQSTTVGGVTENDRYILETLADQVAIALENARLYKELASAHDEIQKTARQLQRLLERTVQIQEQERRRIAADIHDHVNQLLYAAVYEAEGALHLPPDDLSPVPEALLNIQVSINRAISEMRKVIFNLWPTTLDEVGLLPSVESSLARFEKLSGIAGKLKIEGTPIPFAPLAQITIYRILQEALHNVQKHAGATVVEVAFSFGSSGMVLSIRDNGEGFNPKALNPEIGQHLGLLSMRERARSIAGGSSIKTRPGEGTELVFEFPYESIMGEEL